MDSISSIANRCLEEFQNLNAFEDSPEMVRYSKPIATSIQDSQGRFKVWSGNLGALKNDRSSLDYRLREAPRTKDLVLKLLADLEKLLSREFAIIVDDPGDEDTETLHADGEDVSDFGSEDASQVQLVAEDISQAIDCLYRAAVQLSQRSTKDSFAKAADIDVSSYEFYDREYINEKYPDAERWLVNRIGRALLKRRQYVKYRELHAAKLAQPPLDAPADGDGEGEGDGTADDTKSVLSATTATTFIEKPEYTPMNIKDDAASIMSATTYSSMVAESLRMPKAPDGALDGEPFLCSICHRMFQFTGGQARHQWFRHVFRDLQPYVCTAQDCSAEDVTFESRHKWFNHEVKNHRQSWTCQAHCSEEFHSYADFEKHVRDNVPGISKEQLPTFVDMCATPLSATTEIECPLCKEPVRGVKQFEKHLGRHLEEIALFALPQSLLGDAEDSDEESDDEDAEGEGRGEGEGGEEEVKVKTSGNDREPTEQARRDNMKRYESRTDAFGIRYRVFKLTEHRTYLFSDDVAEWSSDRTLHFDKWQRRLDNQGRKIFVIFESGIKFEGRAEPYGKDELPAGWEKRRNVKENEDYYVDHNTQTTTWMPPPKSLHERELRNARWANVPGELPRGWESRVTDKERLFFVDHNGRITTWRDPRLDADLVPTAVPAANQAFDGEGNPLSSS